MKQFEIIVSDQYTDPDGEIEPGEKIIVEGESLSEVYDRMAIVIGEIKEIKT